MRGRTGVDRLALRGGSARPSFASRMLQLAHELTSLIASDCECTAG